jgi:hypothetical protein
MTEIQSSVLYISRSQLPPPASKEQWHEIQNVSLARNSMLDVTGVLIATPDLFAQFLEGSTTALQEVMDSILADSRHIDVVVVQPAPSTVRRFPEWRMGCFGPGTFVSRHLQPTIQRHHRSMTTSDASAFVEFLQSLCPDGGRSPTFSDA